MSTPIFISRNFVEFGPFLAVEVLDFHSRGILGELDHVREDGQDEWLFITEWVEKGAKPAHKTHAKKAEPAPEPAPAPEPVAAPAPAAKKAAVKAAAPAPAPAAKKAAAKKAK